MIDHDIHADIMTERMNELVDNHSIVYMANDYWYRAVLNGSQISIYEFDTLDEAENNIISNESLAMEAELEPRIETKRIKRLKQIGILPSTKTRHLEFNIGESNYAKHVIQPWHIWKEYSLNPWDADIVKRVLRTKPIPGKSLEEARIDDYQKIIHICQERISQIELGLD
jgi:hypothetical protein